MRIWCVLLACMLSCGALAAAEGDDVAALKKEVAMLRQKLNAAPPPNAFNTGDVLSVIKMTTSKDEADAFVKTFQESPKAGHKMKGFRGLAVAENTKQPGSFIIISVWESEAALNAYVQSKAFGEDHEKSGQIKSAQMEPPARYVVKDN